MTYEHIDNDEGFVNDPFDAIPVGMSDVECFPINTPKNKRMSAEETRHHLGLDGSSMENNKFATTPKYAAPEKQPSGNAPDSTPDMPQNKPAMPLRGTKTILPNGSDGIHSCRGMSLLMNCMFAEGCFTQEQICVACAPMTKHGTVEAAMTKLVAHIRNVKKHGGRFKILDGKYISCKDVVLPE